ncbi:MAG: penicillin-binding protein 2 [Deltaproteobacteria bacterium]|nr:penicillin-binding protein 2 [Deltaproteobacteria bacterium]
MAQLRSNLVPQDYYKSRVMIFSSIIWIVMAILLIRLWSLQLIMGESFDDMAIENRIRLLRLPPPRGAILDRNGKALAENRPNFTLSIVPGNIKEGREIIETYSDVLGFSPEKMRSVIEKSMLAPRFMSFPIKKNISLEEVSLIKAHSHDLKGVSLDARPYRHYPFCDLLCHIIGVTGEISGPELEKVGRVGYRPGDYVGKTGIEREYETYLRGEEGWEQIEIDAKGRHLASLTRKPAKSGADIVLTIDASFQKFVEDTFTERAGSVVVVDPDTGRVLAMVSKPGYDPNLFSPSISELNWKSLNSDPLHPLENRSIRGLYPPASTFKIVTALAGLSERVITPERNVFCSGEMELGGQVYRCWKQHGHGPVNLHRAIVESCDVYFYELGLKLGADRMAKYASLFGLGKPTGLELSQELPGLIPTNFWKERNYGTFVKDGENVTIGIGQGYTLTTPIQLAMMTAALDNGGNVMRPYLVEEIRSRDGSAIFRQTPVVRWKIKPDPNNWSLIRKAMRGVVEDKYGTGRKCRVPGLSVYAKTGTSQVISAREKIKSDDDIPYHERTHAMFVAFVDDQPKKMAVVVVIEHGGGGGKTAAPLARKIICRYYGLPDPGDPRE